MAPRPTGPAAARGSGPRSPGRPAGLRGEACSRASAGPATATPVSPATAPTAQPCGAAAPETLVRTVGLVATRIYANELSSSEVFSDKRQVESFAPLLSALASGNRAGVREAVKSLVFSHTHVVRLRVTRGGEVIADVGGPEILTPASGSLRRCAS